MNSSIILKSRPVGNPQIANFEFLIEDMPQPVAGEVLLRTKFVSVDPYLRGRMSEAKSYIASFELDSPMTSGIIAEVIESQNLNFVKGDYVSGMLQWKEYQTSNGLGLIKLNPGEAPLSAYLGILGMPGLTAYFGLNQIGVPKNGETVVISGAAGAVGLVTGQLAKIMGCRVVGIAGTDEKVELLKSKFGFDEALNYNSFKNSMKDIAKVCPSGVDIYFDNVGGEISDAVMASINKFARIIICGAISQYNATSIPIGPRLQPVLLKNSALMQGFIISNYSGQFPGAIQKLTDLYNNGLLKNHETIVEGFSNIPQAFIDLFTGMNIGKMVVKVY